MHIGDSNVLEQIVNLKEVVHSRISKVFKDCCNLRDFVLVEALGSAFGGEGRKGEDRFEQNTRFHCLND